MDPVQTVVEVLMLDRAAFWLRWQGSTSRLIQLTGCSLSIGLTVEVVRSEGALVAEDGTEALGAIVCAVLPRGWPSPPGGSDDARPVSNLGCAPQGVPLDRSLRRRSGPSAREPLRMRVPQHHSHVASGSHGSFHSMTPRPSCTL